MRYANARFNQKQRDEAYRIYVSECLRMTTINTAKIVGNGSEYMAIKYSDFVNTKPQDNRSGSEIAKDIFGRAGIEVIY